MARTRRFRLPVFLFRRGGSYLLGALVLLALAGAYLYWSRPTPLTVAVGPRDTADARLIEAFARLLDHERRGIRLAVTYQDDVRDAAAALQDGRADLAVVRPDVRAPTNGLTLAVLRDEALVVAAPRSAGIADLAALAGRRLGLVARHGADATLVTNLLRYDDLTPTDAAGPIGPDAVGFVTLAPEEVAAALAQGRVDAVSLVAAPTSPTAVAVVRSVERAAKEIAEDAARAAKDADARAKAPDARARQPEARQPEAPLPKAGGKAEDPDAEDAETGDAKPGDSKSGDAASGGAKAASGVAFADVPDGEAITQRYPEVAAATVPAGAFGGRPKLPEADLKTVGVSYRLMARDTLRRETAALIVQVLFEKRGRLAAEAPSAGLLKAPDFDSAITATSARLANHPGAVDYFQREQLTFFQAYGDWVYLAMFGAGSVGSALAWVGQRLRRKRRALVDVVLDRLMDVLAEARDARDPGALDALALEIDSLVLHAVRYARHRTTDTRSMSALILAIDSARAAVNDRRRALGGALAPAEGEASRCAAAELRAAG